MKKLSSFSGKTNLKLRKKTTCKEFRKEDDLKESTKNEEKFILKKYKFIYI